MSSNRHAQGAFITVIAVMAVTLLTGCPGVKYPNCEKDDDCKADADGGVINQFCVNQQCQPCGNDDHCAAGEECVGNRCEAKSECATDTDCGDNKLCEAGQCVPAECNANEDCSAGLICEGGRCVSGCTSDAECGGGMKCENGSCVGGGDNISAECRSTSGTGVALGAISFNFNTAELTVESRDTLEQNAECMRQAPDLSLTIEGHCDERGTQEYNLALGEKRANSVRQYLSNLGISASRVRTVSKGENEPVCRTQGEGCWGRNRRVEFIQ